MKSAEGDNELAARLASEAGIMLMTLRAAATHQGKALGTEGDRIANTFLMQALRDARRGDAILSEEEADSAARLSNRRVWIIDPLDGTREYGEGRDDWAVHVALSVDGIAIVGAVALPARGLTLDSGSASLGPVAARCPRMVVSRSRPPEQALSVAKALGAELLPMGSAGAKAMAVVLGDADIYLHAGGQYAWDNAAPVAVAQAAGLHCSRIDGSPLRYNGTDTYVPDLLICRPEWVDAVMAAL
ncbi:MAG: 3'(2'),5'-bisphosphate nucleotidase CysQ [Pseudomonadota bacterium]